MVHIKSTPSIEMNLFFDTETDGLIEYGHKWDRDYKAMPNALSLAWKMNDVKHYYLIHQDGRKVPKAITEINGLTTAEVNGKYALPYNKVIELFIADILKAGNVIGFNTWFDASVLRAHTVRHYGMDTNQVKNIVAGLEKLKRVDVMREAHQYTAKLCKGKWPKLTFLHEHLIGSAYPAHDALEDVLALERCFIEMKKRKWL